MSDKAAMLKMSRVEALRLIVALVEMGDEQIVYSDLVNSVASESDEHEAVREATSLVIDLRRHFDYRDSPEFLELVAGKSDSYVRMTKRIWSDPVKVRGARKRLDEALGELLQGRQAYFLVPKRAHEALDRIVLLLSELQVDPTFSERPVS